ncbi:hypothetical protein BJV82DRAFT_594043 [Fennellomyces sp. T-0311]|nr:hypothetical protein BJV82DRAFT_594043 [Fennellomyces sp. T-0311]
MINPNTIFIESKRTVRWYCIDNSNDDRPLTKYSTHPPSSRLPRKKPRMIQQDDDLQTRRQELLKHYLVQHQRHSRQLEEDDREKLQRQVQHLKRMVTLLRTLALSSTSLDDTDATVSYERKLQILFQEISALHREQDHSAQQYRELQHRHEALCAQLREKDEMVSCLQSDLRAYMINE